MKLRNKKSIIWEKINPFVFSFISPMFFFLFQLRVTSSLSLSLSLFSCLRISQLFLISRNPYTKVRSFTFKSLIFFTFDHESFCFSVWVSRWVDTMFKASLSGPVHHSLCTSFINSFVLFPLQHTALVWFPVQNNSFFFFFDSLYYIGFLKSELLYSKNGSFFWLVALESLCSSEFELAKRKALKRIWGFSVSCYSHRYAFVCKYLQITLDLPEFYQYLNIAIFLRTLKNYLLGLVSPWKMFMFWFMCE